MSGPNRTISAAPPPRRAAVPIDIPAPASEEAAEGSHELNLDGFTSPGSTPPAGERSAQPALVGRRVSPTGMTKTTVQLPNWLVGRLRAWRRATGRSNADAMLTAYLNRLQAVQERHAPADDDPRRAELGLPPLAATLPAPAAGHGRGAPRAGRAICPRRSGGRGGCRGQEHSACHVHSSSRSCSLRN